MLTVSLTHVDSLLDQKDLKCYAAKKKGFIAEKNLDFSTRFLGFELHAPKTFSLPTPHTLSAP